MEKVSPKPWNRLVNLLKKKNGNEVNRISPEMLKSHDNFELLKLTHLQSGSLLKWFQFLGRVQRFLNIQERNFSVCLYQFN